MKVLLVTLALGATLISTQAFAQDGSRWANRNETRQEAVQRADRTFDRFDFNHQGVITRQQAEQLVQQYGAGRRGQRMIERMFGDSQSLTRQQAEAEALAKFDRDDLNHNGVVTPAEREQAKAMRAAGQNPGQ